MMRALLISVPCVSATLSATTKALEGGHLNATGTPANYIKTSNKNAYPNWCIMDAYNHPASYYWDDSSTYLYDSLQECFDLCDKQADCAGFVDEYGSDCVFVTRARWMNRDGDSCDVYEKTSSPTSTCSGGWPQFASASELNANPWSQYFTRVYGFVPQFSYPLCIGDFWHFYDDIISATGASAPSVAGQCPTYHAPEGQRYTKNNEYQPSGVSFSWHAPPYLAFASNTWAEVSHAADPFNDEHYGMWLLWAKGNGVWFNIGNTRSFGEHSDAYTYFGSGGDNEALCKKAAIQGYESIQFVSHRDHVNYPCDTTVGYSYMGIEIVAVKLSGTYACGAQSGAPSSIRAGWQGSSPCQCDNSRNSLNCGVFARQVSAAVV